jgi:ADP-ribosyl-[dinitrogen reductase] hydrolase
MSSNESTMDSTDRARGVLLGLACGDALGRPVEFMDADQIQRRHGTVSTMLGNGTHRQPQGTITDDTEMALCIARSLVDHGQFDPEDIASRFVDWYESGQFDIGLMTSDALGQIQAGSAWDEAGEAVWKGRTEGQNAGNGSVMRCAPLAIAFQDDADALSTISHQSSSITHYDPRCRYGCEILNHTIAGYLQGRDDPLATSLDRVDDAPEELVSALTPVPDDLDAGELETNGYVVTTLQTALYHALAADTARDAIVEAVNMGGDADTIGAITGAVAGARFGSESLPEEWVATLRETNEDVLARLADGLAELAVES